MTKEEKIKEAWGKYYERVKNSIDEDGVILGSSSSYPSIKFDSDGSGYIQPKSLQGIENNNGWIKIESENMILPIDGTEVHFYHSFTNENGAQTEYHKGIFNAALGFTSYYDSENYKVKEITHYQPIEKPKPPLY